MLSSVLFMVDNLFDAVVLASEPIVSSPPPPGVENGDNAMGWVKWGLLILIPLSIILAAVFGLITLVRGVFKKDDPH